MAAVVYALCGLTALLCAVLLLRSWGRTKSPLLLWSGLCFVGLTLNNVLLFVDLVLVPELDLHVYRNAAGLVGFGMLVYGLVWETR